MLFHELYNIVEKEYDDIIASLVVVAVTINVATKISKKDAKIPGRFTEKINKKTRSTLWEYNTEDIELAIEIRDAWKIYSDLTSLHGVGVKWSIRNIVQDQIKMKEVNRE